MSTYQPSATKSGPGRRHKYGYKRAKPVRSAGAPMGFIQRKAYSALRRLAIAAAGGIRQYKRARSAHLRAARDAARAA